MSSYGAINHGARPNGGANHSNSEEEALLPRKDQKPSAPRQIYEHLNVDVSKNHGDLILLACYTVTGILDSCATAAWGSFVSMQTGNTIYAGLGLSDPYGSTRWIKSGTSIILFCFGSFCFSRFHRHFGLLKRWVLVVSFTIQLLMIVAAALISTLTPSSHGPNADLHWYLLVPVGLLAFQSSGQAVTSRVLQQGGLTSVVLTSLYCDLFSDARLFAWPTENVPRNQRAAAPILVLIGAICGGLWSKSAAGLPGALWTAAVLKGLITIAWLFWRADTKAEDD